MPQITSLSLESAGHREPTLLEIVRDTIITYKSTAGEPLSLTDVTKIARAEPITVYSDDLVALPELYDISQGILNIFTAYYLQAVSLLSVELQDIRILKILDKVNPDRDMKSVLASGYTSYESRNLLTLSLEGSKYKLPVLGNGKGFSFEFANDPVGHDDSEYPLQGASHNSSVFQKVEYLDKLPVAVGKVVEVKFTFNANVANGRKVTNEMVIPVVVKLDSMVIPTEAVTNIVTSNKEELKLSSRFRAAINGRIHFIRDFLLCQDLIKLQKKTMMKDQSGVYSQILKRINNSRLYSALTGSVSIAGITGIFVISEQTENEIQKTIGGKLTNKTTREIVFQNTMAMLIVVVDRSWERVTIYARGIDGYSQNTYADFKAATGKDSGANIVDILKAFSLGNSPSF
jgi:hypothetical protein